jgi:hypothetical protein
MHYNDIRDIKRANAQHGSNWFEPSTMRFFKSRILPTIYAGRFFITSEDSGIAGYYRAYSIRIARDSGEIATVGEFQGYGDRDEAIRALKTAFRSGPSVDYAGGKPDAPEDHFYWQAKIGDLPIDVRQGKADAESIAAEVSAGLFCPVCNGTGQVERWETVAGDGMKARTNSRCNGCGGDGRRAI